MTAIALINLLALGLIFSTERKVLSERNEFILGMSLLGLVFCVVVFLFAVVVYNVFWIWQEKTPWNPKAMAGIPEDEYLFDSESEDIVADDIVDEVLKENDADEEGLIAYLGTVFSSLWSFDFFASDPEPAPADADSSSSSASSLPVVSAPAVHDPVNTAIERIADKQDREIARRASLVHAPTRATPPSVAVSVPAPAASAAPPSPSPAKLPASSPAKGKGKGKVGKGKTGKGKGKGKRMKGKGKLAKGKGKGSVH